MTLKANDSFAWCLQSTAGGLTYGTPQLFTCTSTSASDGTEICSSTLAASFNSDDDLVGYWVEVVSCSAATGREKGGPIRRRIVGYDDSAFRLDVDALGFVATSGDQFALLKPPHKWLAEDTGGSQSLISCGTRNEADDELNGTEQEGGYYVEVVKASAISESTHVLTTNWTNSTHDLSTASMGASTAVGDYFELWKYPEVDNLLEFNQPRIDRTHVTGSQGIPGGVAGLKEGSGSQTVPARGGGSTRIGDPTDVHPALAVPFSTLAVTDFTVSSGSSTSTVVVRSGTPVAGRMYGLSNGDVFVASAYASPNVTASPTLRAAPVDNATAHGCRMYKPADLLQAAVSVKQWHGKEVLWYAWGGVPTISLNLTRGELPKWTFGWQFAHHSGPQTKDEANAALTRSIRPKTSSVTPRAVGRARVSIGNTEFEARSVVIDWALEYAAKVNIAAPDQSDGFWRVKDAPTLTIEAWLDTDTKAALDDFYSGVDKTVLVQSGGGYGDPGVIGFWAYKAEYTGQPAGEDSGVRTQQLALRVIEDRTETTLPRWILGTF